MRTQADILTMSATPIPRTLQMSFFGVRDLSIIETPPPDRRAIRTSIMRFDDDVIREGIMRELSRGGQVYFVHNRVRSIHTLADYLSRLVPEARIEVAHGQMEEKKLEETMVRFMKQEFNVLVCTTIIETGIDVPSANTMFIDHAQDFGLSQLYQLRGRVGRSKDRAFATLLIPGDTDTLTPVARKRLEILHRFSDLGAGFKVAQHDLELRGAGDLLGKSQHGHITAVGFDLYAELLKEAVEELRGRAHDESPDPDITLPIPAFIPDTYIVDMHERLGFYQRLATAKDGPAIYDVVGAMEDLCGEPPAEVVALAEVMVLKQRLKKFAARALEVSIPVAAPDPRKPEKGLYKEAKEEAPPPPRVVITLGNDAHLDPTKLLAWVAENEGRVRLTPQMKLVYSPDDKAWRSTGEDVLGLARTFLRELDPLVSQALKDKGPAATTNATPA
jgi:transcription-repair coupling factor (superfamily II helicase)